MPTPLLLPLQIFGWCAGTDEHSVILHFQCPCSKTWQIQNQYFEAKIYNLSNFWMMILNDDVKFLRIKSNKPYHQLKFKLIFLTIRIWLVNINQNSIGMVSVMTMMGFNWKFIACHVHFSRGPWLSKVQLAFKPGALESNFLIIWYWASSTPHDSN